jgi:hypothetical protein
LIHAGEGIGHFTAIKVTVITLAALVVITSAPVVNIANNYCSAEIEEEMIGVSRGRLEAISQKDTLANRLMDATGAYHRQMTRELEGHGAGGSAPRNVVIISSFIVFSCKSCLYYEPHNAF